MGQLKKILPKKHRDTIFDVVDSRLSQDGIIRKQLANGISAAGAVLVASGAAIDKAGYRKTGMALRGVGQTADDIDGDVSRRLGTNGKTGALVDATFDKVKVAIEVATLWKNSTADSELHEGHRKAKLAVISGKHIVNAALNTYIEASGAESATSEAGKVNMWMDGLTIGFWGISDVVESSTAKHTMNTLGNAAFAGGLITGALAMYGYANQAFELSSTD
jgi:phosphatidylglycerophosphate synthase